MSYLTRAFAAAQLLLKANAPTIMVVGGVASMGAGAVVACKKTLKVEEVLTKHTPDLDKIQKGLDSFEEYDIETARADRIKVYTRASLDLGKLYAVPTVLFVGGTALVFGGHRLMLQRNATLAIAFTTLKTAFDKYRQNVVDEFGSAADQGMMNGYVMREVVDEDGKTQTIKTRDWDESDNDPYNRVFSQENSSQWEDDLGVNRMFVSHQERFAQQRLNLRGYLYLYEVYEALGFEVNDVSRVVGWKVKELPDGSKDIPAVDFGLNKPHPDDWKYNKEKAIYLDFNCTGLIVGGKIQKILEQA